MMISHSFNVVAALTRYLRLWYKKFVTKEPEPDSERKKALEGVAKDIGKTVDEFIRWTETFTPDYIYFNNDDGTPCCVYTDGDSGAVLFKTFCEIFEEDGLEIRNIRGGWCDVDLNALESIGDRLRWLSLDHLEKLLNDDPA
jgi:hypothetical protein